MRAVKSVSETRRLLVIVALLLIGVVGGQLYSTPRTEVAKRPGILGKGDRMPDIMVYDTAGQPHELRRIRSTDRPTVVIIFRLSCVKCVGEAIEWERMAQSTVGSVAFLGAMHTVGSEDVVEFRKQAKVSFPFYQMDRPSRVALQSTQSPTIYVTDQNGRITFAAEGQLSTAKLADFLKSIPPGGFQSSGS